MATKIITDEYVFKGRVHFQNYTKFRRAPIYGELESLQPKQGEWYKYSTGQINRSDWTNVHLGSDTTKNADSNVTHNLNAPLSDLLVKVLISTDGTDANSFEMGHAVHYDGTIDTGITIFNIDNNNIRVQTGSLGFKYNQDSNGAIVTIAAQDWYYEINIWKLG